MRISFKYFCCRFYVAAFVGVSLLLLGVGCSGGGGGGGEGRTRETAVRLVHGSLDGSPLEVKVAKETDAEPVFIQKAAFAQITEYVPVDDGASVIEVLRANTPEVELSKMHLNLEPETEYTLFVVGEARDRLETIEVISEPVERPDKGFTRVQVLNALEGGGSLLLEVAGVRMGPVAFGSSSGYVQVPSGMQTLVVKDSGGREIARMDRELVERGDSTLLVCGSEDLGLRFLRVYEDLD